MTEDRPAMALCRKCRIVTYQTIIGDRDRSGLLMCRGCKTLNDFTNKDASGMPGAIGPVP